MDGIRITLYAYIFIISAGFSLITPFYPPLAFKKGGTYFLVGLTYSINALTAFLFTFIYGKLMKYFGKRNLIIFGTILYTISINAFGLLYYVDDTTWFFALSIILKIIQGNSGAAVSLPIQSFVPMFYPDEIEKRMQELEGCNGMGFILGTLLGTGLQAFGGYQLPFYVMGNVLLLLLYPAYKYFPSRQDEKGESAALEKHVNYRKILSKYRILAFYILNILVVSNFTMCASFVSQFLIDEYKFNQSYVNYFFNLIGAQYIFILLCVNFIDLKPIMRRMVILGTIVNGTSMLIIGPDQLIKVIFGIPNSSYNLLFPTFGAGFAAFGYCIVLILSVQYHMHVFNQFEDLKDINKGDSASVLFSSAWHFSEFLGPVIGGVLCDKQGLKRTAAIIGCITVLYAIVFSFVSKDVKPKEEEGFEEITKMRRNSLRASLGYINPHLEVENI